MQGAVRTGRACALPSRWPGCARPAQQHSGCWGRILLPLRPSCQGKSVFSSPSPCSEPTSLQGGALPTQFTWSSPGAPQHGHCSPMSSLLCHPAPSTGRDEPRGPAALWGAEECPHHASKAPRSPRGPIQAESGLQPPATRSPRSPHSCAPKQPSHPAAITPEYIRGLYP